MRFKLAIVIGRIIRAFGSKNNRSTNLPGNIAIKICPHFFSNIKFKGKIIAVTGSNGKTTTSNMIAFMLREAGYSVANNAEGSNLSGGIATTLLSKCTLDGVMDYDYVVFEVDERFARIIFREFTPNIMLVTNLVRDQVVRNGHPDIIMEKLKQGIASSVQLVLNSNDPISSELAADNPVVYFGVEKTAYSTQNSENITQDCKVCPHCFHHLHYNFYHY
ncbi:MAG: Mur ligase family protein, partial [Oscillospiraceae bacterium]